MENTLGWTTTTKIQDENKNSDGVKVSDFNCEESFKENILISGSEQIFENSDPHALCKESTEKASPTLLESAFNVMRNLFSPDKSRNKPTKPLDNQKSMHESSNNNIHLPNKESLGSSVPEISVSVMKPPLSEELPFPDKKLLSRPMLSPLPHDLTNNADDSFLTTVSHNDESFQSAVTHLDENGEGTKNGCNLSSSMFNNSQNLDSGNSCNSSFENSECSLENTMLKNDTGNHKEVNHSSDSVKQKNGINNIQKIEEFPNADFPDGSTAVQTGVLKIEGLENTTKVSDSIGGKSITEKNSAYESCSNSEFELNEHKEILNLFVQPVFEHLATKTQSPKCLSNDIDNCVNIIEENNTILDGNVNCDLVEAKKIEISDELATEETVLQNSLSYTTLHLSKADLNEVDEMLLSLKEEAVTTSCLESINENDFIKSSVSHVNNEMFVKHPDKTELKKQSASCIRSENSHLPKETNSSVDVALLKIDSLNDTVELTTCTNFKSNLSDGEICFKNNEERKCENSELGSESMPQRSYTVLCADSNLIRPVISSSSDISTNVEPVTPTNNAQTECGENVIASETDKVSPRDPINMFSVKHSTPVLESKSYICLNSPEVTVEPANSSADNLAPKESSNIIESSKAPDQFTVLAHALDKPEMQISKSKSPFSSKLNETYEMKSIDEKKIIEEKLESPGFDQTFLKKSASLKTEIGESAMNKTYDKVPDKHNLTYTTEPQKNKSPSFNELNNTYVKGINKTPETVVECVNDKECSGNSDYSAVNNFLSPIKVLNEPDSQVPSISLDESLTGNIDGSKSIDVISFKEGNHSFLSGTSTTSPASRDNSIIKNQDVVTNNKDVENLSEKLQESNVCELPKEVLNGPIPLPGSFEPEFVNVETFVPEENVFSKNDETDLAKLIEQQFTPTEIDKICDVAGLSENLNGDIYKADGNERKIENLLSPKSFDFLNSIQGKPTGRDLSRESLYVKFDPLVQPSNGNSLIDFTKEAKLIASCETPPTDPNSSTCEELLSISPEKKTDAIIHPLTPLSDRSKISKNERIKELENEIYFLKNLYAERERTNKTKMEEYESQIAKITWDNSVLEEKLKEYDKREKDLMKKLTTQSQGIGELKGVLSKYVIMMTELTEKFETSRRENINTIKYLTAERDGYLEHLESAEAAFADVHNKYEKSKKMIDDLKRNTAEYKTKITEYSQKFAHISETLRSEKQKCEEKMKNITMELHDAENKHNQEVALLRAQLRKTEVKVESLQESLDQKIKENQELTKICDELIEGKK